jgi:hypothetical protein
LIHSPIQPPHHPSSVSRRNTRKPLIPLRAQK